MPLSDITRPRIARWSRALEALGSQIHLVEDARWGARWTGADRSAGL